MDKIELGWSETFPTVEDVQECSTWWGWKPPSAFYSRGKLFHVTLELRGGCVCEKSSGGNHEDNPPLEIYAKGWLWKKNVPPAPPTQ